MTDACFLTLGKDGANVLEFFGGRRSGGDIVLFAAGKLIDLFLRSFTLVAERLLNLFQLHIFGLWDHFAIADQFSVDAG